MSATPGAGRAGAGEIIYNLGVCLRICAMYDLSNGIVNAPIEKLVASVNSASRDGGTISIQAVHDKFFLNKRFVRLDASAYEQLRPLLQIFKRLNINEIAFNVERLEERQVRAFIEAFKRYYPSKDPAALAGESFEAVAVRTIDGTEADAFDALSTPQQTVVRQYCLVMVYLKRVSDALKTGAPTRLAGLRRMLQALSDSSEGYEALLVAATGLPQLMAHPQAHQARCAAMTLLMGKRLGVSRASLIDIALAALFHDIARDDATVEQKFDPETTAMRRGAENDEIRRLSLRSIVRMCRSGVGLDSHVRLAVAREVWSPLKTVPVPSLPARLVSVVCAFDLLTRPTATRRGMAPDRALRFLASKAGSRYDLRLLRLFASAIGVYPAGTLLELTDGSLALVKNGATGSALPQVHVVRRLPVAAGSGPVRIAGCADARERGINVVHHLMG